MAPSLTCYKCYQKVELTGPLGREATCEHCHAYLHCCRNCRFYDVTAYNECCEPMAERVLDKEQANFCDYFSPAEVRSMTAPDDKPKDSTAKDALERLFKKS